jgi:Leu/Phe-tRNA-protein transferase
MSQIYYITKADIEDKDTLINFIYSNTDVSYYYTELFDEDFYITLAKVGFISISHTEENIQYLLPEMQKEYAVMDFEKLHISKKVNKLLKQDHLYSFSISHNIDEVAKGINKYHVNNWMEKDYLNLLYKIKEYKHKSIDFELLSCELKCNVTNTLVAGEIGYRINSTYTSLSGFTTKEKQYNNYGKLQMTLLCQYLEKNNYSFWNMGHPYMQYKIELGAVILTRKDFLLKWLKKVNLN